MGYARPELLVEPEWLEQHIGDDNVRVIDCATVEAYRRSHIDGAVHNPKHYYIKEAGGREGGAGMFVMPPADFEDLMGKLGVDNDTLVVTYDVNNGLVATRLWWVLNYYGHTNVKVLNGGWHRWASEGRPVTFHGKRAERTTFKTAAPNADIHASKDRLSGEVGGENCHILDARTDGEWDGSNNRGNARVGRVPGSRHLEWVRFVARTDDRKFLPADDLQALLDKAGIDRSKPAITYCQGGIRAAHAAFVLTLLGYDNVRVYDGSMYEWANDEATALTLED